MKKYLKNIRVEVGLYVFVNFSGYFFYSLIPYYTKVLFEGEYIKALIGYTSCLGLFISMSYLGNIIQVKYKMKFNLSLKEAYFNRIANMKYDEFKKKDFQQFKKSVSTVDLVR